ncbi:MAG TPA: LuxR C-terminal-related transcriptional regulator [Candidatus Dormibacteraeota bacterium]|nr:LuxR C-terminal-related transcriptional regulator [Candidatus Dormibacteraeota bacterium]
MARPTRRPGNLPAESTSFVGRRHELAELRRKLASTRLVSLVGPGGVGKTRLALRAATDLGRGFRDGAWLVELAEVRDGALVANAVLAALDLRAQAATEPLPVLLAFLKDKELLLLVDNCEHLLGAVAPLIADVLAAGQGVRVVATSREPLSVAGEHVLPVPPLELPSPSSAEPLHQLRQNEAMALFVERAAAAAGSFELTEENRVAVVDLCRRLDGLPLAIELAAVRTRVLSPTQLLQRLSDRFALLTGGSRAALPRHQTLRTAIDWSYDLLTEDESRLFRALCVFAGRFTLEDVDAVGPGPALETLSSLVEKSLVIKEDAKGLTCFRLHETMREYAAVKLRDASEEEAAEERCVEHYHMIFFGSGLQARYRLAEWLEWMDLEIDNVRAVLRRCLVRRDFARGVDIATSAGWYWITRATAEGVWWLDQLLASGLGNEFSLPWAYFMRGFLDVLRSNPSGAREPLERAIAASRAVEMANVAAHALSLLSIVESMAGDHAAAARLLDEARSVASGVDDVSVAISALQARCLTGLFAGDVDGVRAAAAEGVRLSRDSGDAYALEMMLLNNAYATLLGGDEVTARGLYAEALGIAQHIDDRIAQYALLYAMACLAARSGGRPHVAAQLLGAAESVCLSAGATVIGFLPAMIAEAESAITASLGRSKLEAEMEVGRAMGRRAAVALALGESPRAPTASTVAAAGGVLGRREAEVAQLVAEGLSNKQIGARLFISERTVATHVGSILNKLGFNSRAQIAAWAAASGDPAKPQSATAR